MEQGPGDLHILYRIVLLLPEQKHLHELNRELTDYYEDNPHSCERKMVGKGQYSLP